MLALPLQYCTFEIIEYNDYFYGLAVLLLSIIILYIIVNCYRFQIKLHMYSNTASESLLNDADQRHATDKGFFY